MCTFFHATNRLFHENDRFSIEMFEGDETYDHRRRPESEQRINDLFDQSRPQEIPLSRKKCIYLFSNLTQCVEYASKERVEHIYEVRSDDSYGPFPMVLVKKCMDNPNNIDIRNEYWHPHLHWKEVEFLAFSFVVLMEVQFEPIAIPMMADYTDDLILANRLF